MGAFGLFFALILKHAGLFRKDEAPAFFMPVSLLRGKEITFFLEKGVRKAKKPTVRFTEEENLSKRKGAENEEVFRAILWDRSFFCSAC